MIRRFFFVCAVSSLLSVAASAYAQTYAEMDAGLAAISDALWIPKAEAALAATIKAYDAGQYEQAIREANAVLAYAPTAWGGLRLLRGRAHASAYAASGNSLDYINARADLLNSINTLPADPWPQVYLGQLYAGGNQAFYAVHHFRKALAIDPNSLAALSGMAQFTYFARDFNGCIDAVQRFMANPEYLREDDGWSHFRLGECHAAHGDKTRAKQHFEQAIALQPERKDSWLYLAFLKDGYTCKKLGRSDPDKPFDRFVAYLREASCPNGDLGSLASILKDDPHLRGYGLLFEGEFRRQLNIRPVAERLGQDDAESFYREAKFLLNVASRAPEIDMGKYLAILQLLNNAIDSEYTRSADNLVEDLDVAAHEMRAHLLIQHPDKQVRQLAWRDQIVLSHMPREYYANKPVSKNAADVKARIIRGLVYAKAKGNQRAAITEFDAALQLLDTGYHQVFDVDALEFAEPHWRKGDALAALGQFDSAAAAYAKALEIKPDSTHAQAGIRQLQENPAASAVVAQALQQANAQIKRNREQAAIGQANAAIGQYNHLVSRTLPDLQRQQQQLERTVADYMARDAMGRAVTHRSVVEACNRVIASHDALIMNLQTLRNGAATATPLVSEIDSQIASLRKSVQGLQQIRHGVVEAL